MTGQSTRAQADEAIVDIVRHSGSAQALMKLMSAKLTEARDFMEEAQTTEKFLRAQGRAQLAREILDATTREYANP